MIFSYRDSVSGFRSITIRWELHGEISPQTPTKTDDKTIGTIRNIPVCIAWTNFSGHITVIGVANSSKRRRFIKYLWLDTTGATGDGWGWKHSHAHFSFFSALFCVYFWAICSEFGRDVYVYKCTYGLINVENIYWCIMYWKIMISFVFIFAESEVDELTMHHTGRHRPEELAKLASMTKFSKKEIKLIYRGFKQVCKILFSS